MKRNLLIPLIWLLIYPVVIPAPLSGYVLCIGADGHVEFEVSTNGRCTDAHPSHRDHAEDVFSESTPDADHCGSCIDLPIFFSIDEQPHLAPSKDIPLNKPNSSVALATTQTHASAILICAPLLGSSPLVYPPPISLRTTPLLI
ncbi:MAG: hypothetical protein OXN17_04685 [Candidatus Poribacteria bacterium]|nr:hypothetical protein [Candidatus Poribacteria bacterium]MDE0506946.1 hypothetical protein [Candidatus Poribacteria bacterium]